MASGTPPLYLSTVAIAAQVRVAGRPGGFEMLGDWGSGRRRDLGVLILPIGVLLVMLVLAIVKG
jgi:hypothetical protein